MAVYDYSCVDCGHVQEEMHPMSGPTEKLVCAECGCTKLDKTFESPNAVIFKGEDWATNKYR